jgi:3-hydroxybutyryl-CoA dehydrogenase
VTLKVVVVGTGMMAPGIAAACAAAGASVTIAGRDVARAGIAAERSGEGVRAASIEERSFSGCDLVIESVLEDLAVKRDLLSRLEAWLEADAVIATNTSSLPVGSLASALVRPGRLAGFHFLNPAALTTVVEIVPGPATAPGTVELLVGLARRMQKLPLVLRRDYPGFIWNRLQMAMIRECVHLLDEGVADLASIDAAVSDGLAPRWIAAGPLGTSDLGGSNTFRLVAEQLFGQLSSGAAVSESLGPGFYGWTDESTRRVTELRTEALRAGRAFAERRRDVYPKPS